MVMGRWDDVQNEDLSVLMRWCEGKGTTRMPYEEFMNKFDGANRMEPEGWTTKPEYHKTTKSTRFKPLYARTPRNTAPLDYTRHSDPSPMSTLMEDQCVHSILTVRAHTQPPPPTHTHKRFVCTCTPPACSLYVQLGEVSRQMIDAESRVGHHRSGLSII
jgi:hypothetical protein